ncbi:MAG: hypothetical protein AB1755_04005 [Candidatus Omnitrophota bacterium]
MFKKIICLNIVILLFLVCFYFAEAQEGISISEEQMKLLSGEYCKEFPDKLEKGEPFKCKTMDPFSGQTLTREIIGKEGDRCHYIQELPGGGKMECKLSPEFVKAMVQEYRDTMPIKSENGQTTNLKMDSGGKRKYMINSKEVTNVLQEAINCKECVMSGPGHEQ